jgi:hypothetical protein
MHRIAGALGLSERHAVWMLYGLATLSGVLALLVRNANLDISKAIASAPRSSAPFACCRASESTIGQDGSEDDLDTPLFEGSNELLDAVSAGGRILRVSR